MVAVEAVAGVRARWTCTRTEGRLMAAQLIMTGAVILAVLLAIGLVLTVFFNFG